MAGERIQFVDSISATAGVRLSLTAAPWSVLFNGTSVPPPPMRRATASTLLVDGSLIPATAYDNRVLTLHLQLDSTSPTAAATQLQLLSRELDRQANFLWWQPDPSIPPVFFRTYRSPDYDPTNVDHGINLYDLTVQIVAEPFSYGLRVDLSPTTINADPTAGSNGRFMDITSVQGDVETPLKISIPGTSLVGRQSLFAMRRRGTPSAAPFVIQAEALTLGTDATLTAGGASYSGSGNNAVAISFGTTGLVNRISALAIPVSASVDLRGTYRVFLRAIVPTPGAISFTFKLQHGAAGVLNSAVTASSVAGPQQYMVDLGLVQMPEGLDPVYDGFSGTAIPVAPIGLSLLVQRITGSQGINLDYLIFVPADDKLCIISWGDAGTTNILDGISRAGYALNASGQISDTFLTSYVGDLPMVSPGMTNRLVYIRDVNTVNTSLGTSSDPVTGSDVLTCSYWPRYLSVRPNGS